MKLKTLLYSIPAIIVGLLMAGIAYSALPVFQSIQVGNTPAAGKVLQTNGTTSTWVATSTLGIIGGGGSSATTTISGVQGPNFTLQGTANQVLVAASTGTLTLSLPQNIATTSSVQFGSAALTSLTMANNGCINFTTLGGATICGLSLNSNDDLHLLANSTRPTFLFYNSAVPVVMGGSCCGGNPPTSYTLNTSGSISFQGGGTTHVTILSSGNVGIGTTSPGQLLTVGNNNQFTVTSGGNVTAGGYISGSNFQTGSVGISDSSWSMRSKGTANPLTFATDGVERIRIQGDGNVGIGTSTGISARLVLQGSTSDNTANALQVNNSSGTGLVTVQNNGNVGIGTTNPIVSFQVNGNWISGNDTVLPNMSGGMTAGNIFHNFNNYGGLLIKKISTGTGDYFEIQDSSANSLMVVKSSGNVGIGTASPQAKLDVNGIASSTTFYAGNGTAANPSYSFSNYHGTGFSTNGAILMSVGGAQVGGFGSAGFTAAGFGIQSATDPLAGGVGLGSSGVINWQATYPTKDIGLSRGAAGKLYVGNGTQGDYTGTLIAGNVGIGTTSPSSKLFIQNAAGTADILDLASSTAVAVLKVDYQGNLYVPHLIGFTATPTIATSTGAGATATTTIAGTDLSGLVQVNTMSADTPAANADIVTITFNKAYGSAPYCTIIPANDATWALTYGIWRYRQSDTTTTIFKIRSGTSPLPATTNAVYAWVYRCTQ